MMYIFVRLVELENLKFRWDVELVEIYSGADGDKMKFTCVVQGSESYGLYFTVRCAQDLCRIKSIQSRGITRIAPVRKIMIFGRNGQHLKSYSDRQFIKVKK